MKLRRTAFILSALAFASSYAQVSPEQYNATHSDSCWYFTFDYNTPKMPSNEGMLVVTHLCTPDTCISSSTRHYQGKRYNRRYVKRNGMSPDLSPAGWSRCTLSVPETAICDTVYGITYCEYNDKDGCCQTYDTVMICMPKAPSMSCHRVQPAMSLADHIAAEHPHIKSIRHYVPLSDDNADEMSVTPHVVRYVTNSAKLNPEYLQNANSIEDMMSIINEVLADSSTTVESVQLVGYTSPDGSEADNKGLGLARAKAMREHIKRHHSLPDSIFEVADGGMNWPMIYSDIESLGLPDTDELLAKLKGERTPQKRLAILKRYDNGRVYRDLLDRMFPAHRMACCTGIYYSNSPDSTAVALNRIVDELINNPEPDYDRLIAELKMYRNDPRVLNLQGIAEYRRHHRHAAEQAFIEAAEMGDEQALVNLQILKNNKNH